MNGSMYREILQNNLLPYARKVMPKDWIFQHDNDPKHTSNQQKSWLVTKKIPVLKWPAQSPDLNPIEHLWDELKRRTSHLKHSNRTDLLQHLHEKWAEIPKEALKTLIESMPRRCRAVIAAKGMPIRY